jgi:hypothetical protein
MNTTQGRKKRRVVDVPLPEVVLVPAGDQAASQRVSRLRADGKLRMLYRGVYSSNLPANDADVVRRNWSDILGYLAPGVVVSHRSAVDFAPHDGELFISRDQGRRDYKLPGLNIRATVKRGRGPLLDTENPSARDSAYRNFFLASQPRAFLECLATDARVATRSLPSEDIEARLERLLALRGERALNALRDAAHEVAERLDMMTEYGRLTKVIGALLGSRPVNVLSSALAVARARGVPYDPERLSLFERVIAQLRAFPFAPLTEPATAGSAREMFAFVESYFSNYIEGTTFTVEEAEDIVFRNKVIPLRSEDSHDVKGTFDAALRDPFYSKPPLDEEHFIGWLRDVNKKVMGARPHKEPGQWKQKANQAGSTLFVMPELVEGTLRKVWPLMGTLELPMQRALMAMFIVSEVHPFTDGNGRTARLLMNCYLSAAQQCRIIVPTVFREGYLLPLKALSHQADATSYIRTLRLCQAWTAELDYAGVTVPHMKEQLAACNALREDSRYRLLSPRTGAPMAVP